MVAIEYGIFLKYKEAHMGKGGDGYGGNKQ
jgi:hypothetical protein